MRSRRPWDTPTVAGRHGCGGRRSPSCPEAAGPARARLERLPRSFHARIEDLVHLPVEHPFLISPARVTGYHAAPEADSPTVAQILGDLPGAGKAGEDQL